MNLKKTVPVILSVIFTNDSAWAQQLVHQPINPSFGGSPFNSAHLLSIANAQNDFDAPQADVDPNADFDRFIRSLQNRLLSSLSTQVANAIFGDDAQESGTVVFGDQTIAFNRGLEGVELTITSSDGSVTQILVPDFQATASSLTGSPLSLLPLTSSSPLSAPSTPIPGLAPIQ